MSQFGSRPVQAVVLADDAGAELFPLTDNVPPALLPVMGRPVFVGQLELLERSGFKEVLLVVTKPHEETFRSVLETYSTVINVKWKVLEEEDSERGVTDVLRLCRKEIDSDFVVLPADQVCEGTLNKAIDYHRVSGASMTALFTENEGKVANPDLVGIEMKDESFGRLVIYQPSVLFAEDDMGLKLAMLESFPDISLRSTMSPCGIFLVSRWVLDLLEDDKLAKFSSLRSQLLPYLVRKQFHCTKPPRIPKNHEVTVNAYKVVVREECMSFTSIPMYRKLNKISLLREATLRKRNCIIHPEAHFQKKMAKIKDSSMVDAGVELTGQVLVNRTIVGQHCAFQTGTVLEDSLIMSHVTAGPNVKVVGSCISEGIAIPEGVSIRNCNIGPGFEFPEGQLEFDSENLSVI